MKITNKMIVEAVAGLNALSELSLPVKLAYKIAKISRKITNALTAYNDVLKKLQQEYAELDENNKPKTVPDADNPEIKRISFKDREAFDAAYEELLEIETELEVQKLKLDDLGDIDIKPATLYQIDWLFEDAS